MFLCIYGFKAFHFFYIHNKQMQIFTHAFSQK